MFESFGPLIISVLVILAVVIAYVFREKLTELFKGRKKEGKKEFEKLLVSRVQKLGDKWLAAWPKAIDVYLVFGRMPENQKTSAAALGGALKRDFASLSRKEADTIARFFLRSVYNEVKHGLAQAAQNTADKK